MYYETIFKALTDAGIRYVVVGGMAVNLHGVPRATMDLDVVLALDLKNITRFAEVMEREGYKPRIPVDPRDMADPNVREHWKAEKHMLALTFTHQAFPFQQIDVILDTPVPFDALYERSQPLTIAGSTVPVAAISDLKEMKRHAGREQDLSDIEMLERVEKIKRES